MPCIGLVAIWSCYVYCGIIGTISSANKFTGAFGIYIQVSITKMPSESTVCSLKKQPDTFAGMIIQVDGNGCPVFTPYGGIASWIWRFIKTRKNVSIGNKS